MDGRPVTSSTDDELENYEDEYDEEVEAADNYQFQERVVHVSSYGRRSQVPAGMASQQQQQQSHGPRGH